MVNTSSVWKFRLGILDYLSRNPVFSGNFPFGKTKLGLHSNRNSRTFVVKGTKQPKPRKKDGIPVAFQSNTSKYGGYSNTMGRLHLHLKCCHVSINLTL